MEIWEELPGVSLVPINFKAPQEKMSAHDGCLSLVKYLLFVFNLFFFVLGSLIFCFGIWILIDKTSFVSFVGLSFMPLQIWSKVLAVSGVLTMGLALLGCVGALKEFRCLLGLYFGTLLLLFATQITLGILISTQRVQLKRKVKDVVQKTIQTYRAHPEETAAEESWDYVQFQLRCCGWESPQDWFHIPSMRSNESEGDRVPCSCYNSSATNDSTIFDKISFPQFSRLGSLARPRHNAEVCSVPANSYIYQQGCERSLSNWLTNNLISIVGICLGVGLLEVSVAGLSLLLPRSLLHREPQPQVPGAYNSSSGPRPSTDGNAQLHDALHIPVQKPGPRLRSACSVPLGPALPQAPPRPPQVSRVFSSLSPVNICLIPSWPQPLSSHSPRGPRCLPFPLLSPAPPQPVGRGVSGHQLPAPKDTSFPCLSCQPTTSH